MKKYPISQPQKRILDSELIDQSSDKYLIAPLYCFKKANRQSVLQAVENIVEKCGDLNIRFCAMGDGATILQYTGKPDTSRIHVMDFSGREEERQAWIKEYTTGNFDPLWDKPLYEFTVLYGDADTTVLAKVHHAIIDGTGTVRLGELIWKAYRAIEEQKESLPDESDYFCYIDAEKDYLASLDFEEDRQYWRKQIADTSDFPEMLQGSGASGLYSLVLDAKLTGSLNELAAGLPLRATPYKLALTAMGIYLARRYRSTSVPVLAAYANRRNLPEEMKSTIGMLVSTLVLKMDYQPQTDFAGMALQADRVLKEALAHGRYPLNFLTEELVRKGENTAKLWNFSVVSNSKTDTEFDVDYILMKNSAFPLVFRVNCAQEDRFGLQSITIEYFKDVFSEKEIGYMAEGIRAMLRDIAANPGKPISELEMLGGEERKILLEEYKGKTLEYDKSSTFVDLFRKSAGLYPQNTAVADFESSYTYGELDSLSDSLAAKLENDFQVQGRFAAIMLPRQKEFILAAVSVMKAGGAYVPVDSGYPQDRIEYMLQDSEAAVLITVREFQDKIGGFGGRVLYFDDLKVAPGEKPRYIPRGDDLCYMIYTSGSTGRPKGVMIRHASLAAMIAWKAHDHEITGGSRVCVHSSFSFDASVIDIFPALAKGAALHVISDTMRFDMAGFYQYIKENKIEDCAIPTQLGMELLRAYELPLKRVMLGGEKLKKLPKRNVILVNGYGPTEFTVASSCFIVDQEKEYANIPIGKPAANSWDYIVDDALRLVPMGCAGELCLAGVQIAKGYWKREDLTEKVFVPNPYATCPENSMMYRTGDLVHWNENGELEYLGRIDDQVKLRGFRVELGEVETAIVSFEGVEAACVLVQKDMLVAYYVSAGDLKEADLTAFLSVRLPEYMVPVAFMRLSRMPVTPGGKVDRKALPKIELAAQEIVAPQNKIQQEIFDCVAAVIGNNAFGVTTDLFYAGMSSLSAIKITAQLCTKYGISMSAQEVIRAKTILGIEARITQKDGAQSARYERRQSYPLTQSQMGVYFDCARRPGTLKYNIPSAFSFSGKIDAGRLARALEKVIDAHPYIKTHLAARGQNLEQIRCDEMEVLIPVQEITEEELQAAKDNFVKPFHLFEGPLFRAAVYKTPQSVCMLTDFHHIIFDGGSLDILLHDLARAYAGEEIQTGEFSSFELALTEAEIQGSEAFRRAQAYFKEKLIDCEGAAVIPPDRGGAEEDGSRGERTASVEKDRIRAFCRQEGITPSNLFLSAVSYTAARFTGSKTVLLSTLSNGRGEANRANILGMMVKTLPLIVTLDSNQTALDFVRQTQQSMFDTMENECYPFTRISEEYHFAPEIMYAFQGGVLSGCQIGGEPAAFESLEKKDAKFKLSVHIEEDEKSFRVCAQYNDALYSPAYMQTFADCVMLAVAKIMDAPEKPAGSIPILPAKHKAAIERFNATGHKNEIRVLHKLFEKQTALHGDQTALIAKNGAYTYSELNADANRIANALLQKGLALEDRVAFLLPRDGRLIAAMLGIMKAGGAYIPIDPEYPEERIHHVLADSSAKYMISCGETAARGSAELLWIDDLLTHEDDTNPETDVAPGNLCYIIYTSGSTGKPKGVMLEHKGICNYVAPSPGNIHVRALAESASAFLSVTTVSFDMFLKESFTVLMNGLTLVFASEEEANNPVQLARLFADSGADAFNATPSRMLQYMELSAFRDALAKCKVIMAGGEGYPVNLFEKLRKISNARLFNTYGPTEITVSSNAKELVDERITVGKPLSNVHEWIVDTDGNQLPVGVAGELWIGGEGVARGYWGNAGLTEKSFVLTPEGRVYKTGDIARWTGDGEVVILGRKDNQVKLRGLRIELGEIQTAVCKYPGIRSAVVTVKNVMASEHICAYFTADAPVSQEKLRDSLKKCLTKYMVPTAYMQLDAIPVTPNGKTDLKALPQPSLMARHDYVAPANDTEKDFCEIFALVLDISDPGVEDDFFDLGGTSLMVTKVTIEAMNKGYNISYGDVFTHPTPKELAGLLEQGQEESAENELKEYDYTAIHDLLKKNTLRVYLDGEKQKLGNVLLTGATGFLGIHVLKEFLEQDEGVIYCFMRKGRQASLEKRLKSMLVYYFNNSYDDLFGTRIFLVEGDISSEGDFAQLNDLPIHTLINCAANVKHYAPKAEIEKINVGGVKNAIDFCKQKGCQLIQISTTSVAGISIDQNPAEDTVMDETMLYFGQDLDNKYISSKFRAERMVLEAITKGLNAKIMRVGNLMARSFDGEFQINFNTNGFVNRLRAYEAIGKITYAAMGAATEFAPIDSTAQAVLKLACAPVECCVFHPYNNHYIYISDVIEVMKERGMHIEEAEECEYQEAFSAAMHDKSKTEALSGLIAYLNMGKGKRMAMLHTSNAYTVQALYRTGFKWPLTTDGYLDKFISLLAGLGFFQEEPANV